MKAPSDIPDSSTDLKVIGQIMTGIGMLSIFPSNKEMGNFLVPLISSVPGCGAAGICLADEPSPAGTIDWTRCGACRHDGSVRHRCGLSESEPFRAFPLQTVTRFYGTLLIEIRNTPDFLLYAPFIRNLGNAVAVILENRRQQNELQRSNAELEQRVKERTEELDTYFRSSRDLLCIADLNGSFIRMNDEWMQTLGYSIPQLIGDGWRTYLHPDDRDATSGALSRLRNNENVLNFSNRFICRDGSIRWLEWRSTPIGGKIYSVARDISERKKYEEFISSDLQYSRSLLEASLDPLVTISMEGTITDANAAAERATGLLRRELIGSDFAEYFTEPEKAREAYRMAFSSGAVTDFPLALRHRSGTVTDVLYNASLYHDDHGNVGGVFAAARDFTERKRTEEQLRKASQYSRSLLEASLDPLVAISADGTITDANAAAERVTGIGRDAMIGSDFAEYFTDPVKAREGYQRVFSQGFVTDYPLAIRHSSGTVTDVLYNASVFRDGNGMVEGVFAAARDITRRKRMEEALRHAQKMESIVTLTAGIAHDFNNLLGAVMGNVSIAKGRLEPGHRAALNLDRSLVAIERAAELTRQMLAYSGKGKFQIVPVDFIKVVQEKLSLFEASLLNGIEVVRRLPEVPVHVKGDPDQIEQAVMNLIINAGEAIGESGGRITVSVYRELLSERELEPYQRPESREIPAGPFAVFQVEDTGCGMDRHTLEKIFDPFFTTKFVGRGLGLSAVLGIVTGHGGGIAVESAEGIGSVFRTIIPLWDAAR